MVLGFGTETAYGYNDAIHRTGLHLFRTCSQLCHYAAILDSGTVC